MKVKVKRGIKGVLKVSWQTISAIDGSVIDRARGY